MIGRLCYCVSPHGKFVCSMLLCAATLTQPARALSLCSTCRRHHIIYIQTCLYQGLPSLCSSLPLHRIRLSSLQGLINTSARVQVARSVSSSIVVRLLSLSMIFRSPQHDCHHVYVPAIVFLVFWFRKFSL